MSRKIYDEDLRLNLILNGEGLAQGSKKMVAELGKLEQEFIANEQRSRHLASQIKILSKDKANNAAQIKSLEKEYGILNKTMKANQLAIDQLRQKVGLTGMTVEQLRNHLNALKVQLYNMPGSMGTPMFKKLQAEIAATEARLVTLTTGASRFAQTWARIEKAANRAGTIMGWTALVIYGISRVVGGVISRMRDLEDLIGNVRKNTNLFVGEVWDMKEAFDRWDTRTRTDDLLKLAVVAGKLGVEGKEGILEFVDAANKIQIALGDDLNTPVEETVNNIAKLTNAFRVFTEIDEKTGKQFTLGSALLRTGDVLNQLAKSSAASAGTILQYMTRLAGVSELANFTIAQIGGLASVLDAVHVPAELGSTALQKMMLQLGNPKKILDFADALSMSVEEFKELLKNDPNNVLMGLLQKFITTKDGLVELNEGLDSFGVRGQRMAAVVGILAQNFDVLRQQQEIGATAWREGISVLNEYSIMNNNFTAEVMKQQKIIRAMTDQMNREAEPAVLAIVKAWTSFVVWIKGATDWIGRHWTGIKALTFAYIALNAATVYRLSLMASEWAAIKLKNLHLGIQIFLMRASILITGQATLVEKNALMRGKLLNLMYIARTQGLRAALVAFKALVLAEQLSVATIVALTGTFVALGAALYYLVIHTKRLSEAQKADREMRKKMLDDYYTEKGNLDIMIERLKDQNITSEERSELLNKIIDQYGNYLPLLKKEGITVEEVTGSYEELINAMGRKITYNNLMDLAGKNNRNLMEANAQIELITSQIEKIKLKRSKNFMPEIPNFIESEETATLKILEANLIKWKKIAQEAQHYQQQYVGELKKIQPEKPREPTTENEIKKTIDTNKKEIKRLASEIDSYYALTDLKTKTLVKQGYSPYKDLDAIEQKISRYNDLVDVTKNLNSKLEATQKWNKLLEGMQKDEPAWKERLEAWKKGLEEEEIVLTERAVKEKKGEEWLREEIKKIKLKYLKEELDDREKWGRTEGSVEGEAYRKAQKEYWDLQITDEKKAKNEGKKELTELEAQYGADMAELKQKFIDGELESDDEYNDRLIKLELQFLADKRDLYKQGSKDYEDAQNEFLDKKLEVEKNLNDKIVAAQKILSHKRSDQGLSDAEEEKELENERWQEEKEELESHLIQKESLSEKEAKINELYNKIILRQSLAHDEKLRKIYATGDTKAKIAELEEILKRVQSLEQETTFTGDDQITKFYDQERMLIEQEYSFELNAALKNHKELEAAEEKHNERLRKLDEDERDAHKKMVKSKLSITNSYIDSLIGIVGAESDIGRAMFIMQKALAIAQIWVDTAATNAAIVSGSLRAAAMLPWPLILGAPAFATATAAPLLAANNTNAILQTGLIAAQTVAEVVQWEKGKYPVKGKDDGKLYQAAIGGTRITGVYNQPTILNMTGGRSLVGERGPELVVDGDTFKRIQLNSPELIREIYAYAGKASPNPSKGGEPVVRQLAGGSFPALRLKEVENERWREQETVRLRQALERLNERLEKPINAYVNKYGRNGLNDSIDEITRFKGSVYKK
jgi:TP901 family phage tail tape measure protein